MSLERYQPKNNVSQLDNRPKLTADNLKKEFDKAENNIGEFINNKLIPSIETGFEEVNEQIGEKADTYTLENKIGEVTEIVDQKYNKLDKKSIEIVTITGLDVTTQGGNGGNSEEGNAISSMTAKEIYDAYSVGKTIIAHIPSLSTAAIVSIASENQCKFTTMSGTSTLDKYTFIIRDDVDIGTECRYERCAVQTFIFDSLHMDKVDYALSANQGRILNERISDLSANKIKDDSDTESPEGTVGAKLNELSDGLSGVRQALDDCERTWNKTYEIDSDSTDDTYPSAKAVWDVLQNFDASDFVESDFVDYNDLDDLNHKNIDTNGKVYNKFYRGIDMGCIPFLLLVQISFEDSPWTYQTLWKDGLCRTRFFWGDEIVGDTAKWSEWNMYITDDVLNEKIGDIDSALEHIIEIQEQLMGVSE